MHKAERDCNVKFRLMELDIGESEPNCLGFRVSCCHRRVEHLGFKPASTFCSAMLSGVRSSNPKGLSNYLIIIYSPK